MLPLDLQGSPDVNDNEQKHETCLVCEDGPIRGNTRTCIPSGAMQNTEVGSWNEVCCRSTAASPSLGMPPCTPSAAQVQRNAVLVVTASCEYSATTPRGTGIAWSKAEGGEVAAPAAGPRHPPRCGAARRHHQRPGRRRLRPAPPAPHLPSAYCLPRHLPLRPAHPKSLCLGRFAHLHRPILPDQVEV